MKIVAVIPTLNEAKNIGNVVRGCRDIIDGVVVSDGFSFDDTVDEALKAGAKVTVASRYAHHGTGANITRGIHKAMRDFQPDVIVLLDGDGQHSPADIPELLNPIFYKRADVVIGRRGEGMPDYRRFGNSVLSVTANCLSRQSVPDPMCGFWAVRTTKLPKSFDCKEQGFGYHIELMMRLRKSGAKFTSVPIKTIYHNQYSDNSSVSAIHLGSLLFFKTLEWRIRCGV